MVVMEKLLLVAFDRVFFFFAKQVAIWGIFTNQLSTRGIRSSFAAGRFVPIPATLRRVVSKLGLDRVVQVWGIPPIGRQTFLSFFFPPLSVHIQSDQIIIFDDFFFYVVLIVCK